MKKRELITISRSLENRVRNQGQRKIGLFNQARTLVEQHVPVTDLDAFAESFSKYLYSELDKRSNGAFKGLSEKKIINLHEINDTLIKKTEHEYKSILLDLDKTYTKVLPKDCGIYAETEDEHYRLKQFKDIEKAVESLIKKNVPIHYGNLGRAFYPITAINGQRLEVNINYIKGSVTY